jgi:hypothetical protein
VLESVIRAVGVDEQPEGLVPRVELVREPGHRPVGRLRGIDRDARRHPRLERRDEGLGGVVDPVHRVVVVGGDGSGSVGSPGVDARDDP